MLLVVLAVAYVLLGKGLPKLMQRTMQTQRMKIVERLPLDQKRTLFVVEVDQKTYLLGGADSQITLIDTLEGEEPDANFQATLELKKGAIKEVKEVG